MPILASLASTSARCLLSISRAHWEGGTKRWTAATELGQGHRVRLRLGSGGGVRAAGTRRWTAATHGLFRLVSIASRAKLKLLT